MILNTLNVFTKLEHKSLFIKFLKKHLSHSLDIELDKIIYNEETKQYEYKIGEKTITFRMISDMVKEKEFLKELKSNKRFCKCHERSIQFAPSIKNSKIVTGIITGSTGKYLHTVIEVEKEENNYILDWTKNLLLKKDDYIQLLDFVELSSYDATEVFYDKELMTKMNMSDIGIKPYLSFRNEFIRDLEKNIHLLSEDEIKEVNNVKK